MLLQSDVWLPNILKSIANFFGDCPQESQRVGSNVATGESPFRHSAGVARLLGLGYTQDLHCDHGGCSNAGIPADAMIESVRDDTWSVKHFDSSHLPFLSQIGELFATLETLIEGLAMS